MIRRLLPPLLLLAACARSAAPPPAHPAPDLQARNDSRDLADGFVIVVDGVAHSDSSFKALGLTAEQIDSVQVCKDRCPGPAVVVYTNRAASRRPPE